MLCSDAALVRRLVVDVVRRLVTDVAPVDVEEGRPASVVSRRLDAVSDPFSVSLHQHVSSDFHSQPRSGFTLSPGLGHVFLLSRWPAAGRLSVSVLCFCPAADLIYGSRWAAYSAPFVAD